MIIKDKQTKATNVRDNYHWWWFCRVSHYIVNIKIDQWK